ncbi:MAG: diacylglycerol/lipid kinase family protein [Candidatus Heimdallarchaeaceae archaeon]
MVSYLFVVNPNARNGDIGKLWSSVEEKIKSKGFDYSVEFTEKPLHAIDLARDVGKDFDCVIATGGDGTVNEVANGVYETNSTFGVLPLGNGNDYSMALLFDENYERSLDVLKKHQTMDLTVGIAEADGKKRYFVNIADTGVGATVSVASFTEAKFLRGFLKYYYLAVKKILQYKNVPTTIRIDEEEEEKLKLVIIAAGVGYRFGGGFQILPENHPFVDDFAICYAHDLNTLRTFYLLNILKPGKHLGRKNVQYKHGRKIEIELSKPLPVEVEGEILSFKAKEIMFEVAPKKIPTIVPEEFIQLAQKMKHT